MKRIALIAHLSEVSGAGVSLVETAAGLGKNGFDVILVLPGTGPLVQRAKQRGLQPQFVLNTEKSMSSAAFADKLKILAGRLSYVLRLRNFLRRNRVQLAYVNSTYTIFAGLAARLAGIPVVWHVHETVPEHRSRGLRLKLWLIERLSQGLLYASASAAASFPAPRVARKQVVKNFVSVDAFQSLKRNTQVEQQYGVRRNARSELTVITSIGVMPRKGTDLLLTAASLLREKLPHVNFLFLVVGDAPSENAAFVNSLQEQIIRLDLNDRIRFTGRCDNVAEIMAITDIFVSAARNEAMPIALTEAMAAGVPVIATDTGDCAALLEHGTLGTVVPVEDPKAIAQAIAAIVDAPETNARRAAMAQQKIISEYGGPDFWQPYVDFLRQLL